MESEEIKYYEESDETLSNKFSMTNSIPQDMNPKDFYHCLVCLESYPICLQNESSGNSNDGAYILKKCGHVFCNTCIKGYVLSEVNDGHIYPKCFGVTKSIESNEDIFCTETIIEEDILNILGDSDEKYKRFKILKENKLSRQCPYCDIIIIGDPDRTPKMHCDKCNKTFCYHHANAHDFETCDCDKYEKLISADSKASQELISSTTKLCPGCGAPVSKTGGCNHMKCHCGVTFCWLCGKQIEDALFPAHFQWWNPTGCTNLQMNESSEPTPRARLFARILSVFQLILLGPLTVTSTIAASILCCGCIAMKLKMDPSLSLCGGQRNILSACMSSWGIFWMALLFILPISACAGGVFLTASLVISLLIYPFYAINRMRNHHYPWPDAITEGFHHIHTFVTNQIRRCCFQRRNVRNTHRYPFVFRSSSTRSQNWSGDSVAEVSSTSSISLHIPSSDPSVKIRMSDEVVIIKDTEISKVSEAINSVDIESQLEKS